MAYSGGWLTWSSIACWSASARPTTSTGAIGWTLALLPTISASTLSRHPPRPTAQAGRRACGAGASGQTGMQALLPSRRARSVAAVQPSRAPPAEGCPMSGGGKAPRRVRVERNIYRRPTGVLEVGFKDAAGIQRWRTVDGGLLAARRLRDELLARRGRGETVAADSRLRFGEAAAPGGAGRFSPRPLRASSSSRNLRAARSPP